MDLLNDLKKLTLINKDVTLSSGIKADYYFDCKKALLDGPTLGFIIKEFVEKINNMKIEFDVIGGVSIGGALIVSSLVYSYSLFVDKVIYGSVVRKNSKEYGLEEVIENKRPEGSKVIIVEDVITTGRSVEFACNKFLEAGNIVVGIVGMIDRKNGGIEYLKNKFNVPISCIFDESEFLG